MMTDKFIEKAQEVHKNKYDYSKVNYINCDTKVKIKCLTHDYFFEQIPYNHINKKAGCPKCAVEYRSSLQRKTSEQFICEAKETHGDDKFNYAETKYTNYNTKITIICNTCKNKFQTNPSTHLKGNGGCRVCYANNLSKNMTKTQTQFVEEAKKIHEDKYDYSLVDYIDSQTNIDIICKIHGKFKQTPNNHLRGKGCKKCATKKISENQKKSKDEFIEDARKIHGDKYDYSKTDYINAKIKITIICKDHGEFKVEPSSHLSGTICNKCAIWKRVQSQKFTKEEFIQKCKNIHGNKYDYSKVNYTNSQAKIQIFCYKHKIYFEQMATKHMNGAGCVKCAIETTCLSTRLSKEEFIKRAQKKHDNKYDYSEIEYKNAETPIKLKCENNHVFYQNPNNHVRFGYGCPFCSGNAPLTTDEFIKKAKKTHDGKYDYSKVDYVRSSDDIEIICKEHGSFFQTPNNHLTGSGCNKCHKKYSKPQIEWLKMLENELGIIVKHAENSDGEHKIKNSRYKADGYCENKNAIFEFHGCYYHGCKKCFPNRNEINNTTGKTYKLLYKQTKNKKLHCENNGYRYFQIWECKWKKMKNNNKKLQKYFEKINKKLK
jgi:hypothetical protein